MSENGLSVEQFYAELKKLGLREHGLKTGHTIILLTRENQLESVPAPDWQTPEQRRETIERLKRRFGIGLFPGN